MRFYELKKQFLKVVRAGKKWSEGGGGKWGKNGGKKHAPESPLPYYSGHFELWIHKNILFEKQIDFE